MLYFILIKRCQDVKNNNISTTISQEHHQHSPPSQQQLQHTAKINNINTRRTFNLHQQGQQHKLKPLDLDTLVLVRKNSTLETI